MTCTELKIDTSFVLDVCEHEDARIMSETMLLLAPKPKLTVCAEGVETQEALDCLDQCGCDRVQGYFIGKPMPGADILRCVALWDDAR